VATDVFAVVSRDVPANPSLRRRVPPAKARHLAADICAVVCGLRPACMIDYAPKMDAGVARAVLETLRADPRSGRHRETRALGVLLVEDVVLIADVDRVMRVFRDVGATGGADRFVAFDPTTSRRMKGPTVKGRYAAWTDARTSSHCAAVARLVPWGPDRVDPVGAGKVPVHDIGDATGLTPIDAGVVGSRCSVPQVALTGLCLGYPQVYTWTEDDVDGEVLRRVLSSMDLTLTRLRARLNVEGADGMEHLVSGWTVPTREDDGEDDEGEFNLEDDGDRVGSFALAWMGEVEAAIDASGGAWSVVSWDTEAYHGPVAL
jgi:hypothetical protein